MYKTLIYRYTLYFELYGEVASCSSGFLPRHQFLITVV